MNPARQDTNVSPPLPTAGAMPHPHVAPSASALENMGRLLVIAANGRSLGEAMAERHAHARADACKYVLAEVREEGASSGAGRLVAPGDVGHRETHARADARKCVLVLAEVRERGFQQGVAVTCEGPRLYMHAQSGAVCGG